MRCMVDGCYEPAYEKRTLIAIERREPGGMMKARLRVITGWCEKHDWMERYYRNLDEYLRDDPRNNEEE